MSEVSEEANTPTQATSPFRFTLRTVFVVMAMVGGALALFIPYAGCLGLFFALLVVAAGWSYLRGNTKGAVGCLVVLGVFWLALQLFGPYTSLRNRVIFVVGTERLQQWAIETLDHPPPADPSGESCWRRTICRKTYAHSLERTMASVVRRRQRTTSSVRAWWYEYHWGIVVGRPGCNPSSQWLREDR